MTSCILKMQNTDCLPAKVPESSENSTEFMDLPPEVLLQIFSYLDLRSLFRDVVLVCKAFHTILTADGIWKTMLPLKWGESINLVEDLDYITDWRNVYKSYDNLDTCWKNKNNKLLFHTLNGHYAAADSVHVMNHGRICISGARDRTAVVWDITDFRRCSNEDDVRHLLCPQKSVLGEHQGWVWTIGSDDGTPNEVLTGCWDSRLRVWDLEAGCILKDSYSYHPAAILCLKARNGIFYTGCYDKKLRMFDKRSGSVVQEFTCHKRPVLSLELSDHLILSGSEDKTIGIYDQRACKYLSSIHAGCAVLCLNLSRGLGYSYLRAGGSAGSLYTYDTSGDRFTFLNLNTLWDSYKVMRLCNFHGALVACSQSGQIYPFSPGRGINPLPRGVTFFRHNGDIADAHSKYGILATASSDDSVGLWKFQDR